MVGPDHDGHLRRYAEYPRASRKTLVSLYNVQARLGDADAAAGGIVAATMSASATDPVVSALLGLLVGAIVKYGPLLVDLLVERLRRKPGRKQKAPAPDDVDPIA